MKLLRLITALFTLRKKTKKVTVTFPKPQVRNVDKTSPTVAPPKVDTGKVGMYYPDAEIFHKYTRARGRYEGGYPKGAVVHFTAGHPTQSISDALAHAHEQGYSYFVIDAEGNVGQATPLDLWGYHTGESKWDGLGKGVADSLVGIEVICAGKLSSSRKAWWPNSKVFPENECRTVVDGANREAGIYHKYTPAQEKALIRLILWLKANNPTQFSFDYVLGHDEVSGPRGLGYRRKNDPGGSLSMTMDALRNLLKKSYGK